MEQLIKLREAKGLTQREVADYLKVGRTTYVKYETGDINLPLQSAIKLAEFYNISVDYLVGKETPAAVAPVVDLQLFADCPEKREALELLDKVPENEMKEVLSFLRFKESQREDK